MDLELTGKTALVTGACGDTADIANLARGLASPRARYITGAVIPVDGGPRRDPF